MSGITTPRPGSARPGRVRRPRRPLGAYVGDAVGGLFWLAVAAYPAGALARAAWELAHIGWHAWPW